jgi:DNA-binding HxlR family transcriptional regulator
MPVSDELVTLIIQQLPNFLGMLIAIVVLSWLNNKQQNTISELSKTLAQSNALLSAHLVDLKQDGMISSLLVEPPIDEADTLKLDN